MKKHLYHLLVFSLLGIFAASCSDDDDAPNIQSEIVGEWRLTSWSESAPEGFEVYVEFTSAATFGLYQKVETSNYTKYTGRYSIDGSRLTGVYDDGESERTLIDVLQTARVSDPEEALIGRESYEAIARDIETILSPLERQSLALYLQGLSYQQIAAALGRSTKCVDNAIQRVKKKLEERLRA